MRLTTNIVDIDPDDVRIGMPVEVVSRITRRGSSHSSGRRLMNAARRDPEARTASTRSP